MSTSFRCHIGFMDNMNEFDGVFAEIGMKAKSFPNIGPIPYEIHGSSDHMYYMADDALTYGDLERAFRAWDMQDNPEEWVEVSR